ARIRTPGLPGSRRAVAPGSFHGAVRLPALAGGDERGAAARTAVAEPGRVAARAMREPPPAGVHAGFCVKPRRASGARTPKSAPLARRGFTRGKNNVY